MILLHSLDEEELEAAFWRFDYDVKVRKISERDAFKYQMRAFARHELRRAGVQGDVSIEEINIL